MYATPKSIKEQKENPQNVDVNENCKVARFDPALVQEELQKRQQHPLRQLLSFRNIKVNIIGQTWYFLLIFFILYYTIQTCYQLDLFCVLDDDDDDVDDVDDGEDDFLRGNSEKIDLRSICRNRVKLYFLFWDEHEQTMTRIITFLLGFYVSMIGKRWWDQVSKLPDVDNLCLVLGGLVWAQPEPGPTSPEAALHFKKTVLRYALLSWTMCLARISSPFQDQFANVQDYFEKHLLSQREADALKMNMNSTDCTSQWWVPLSWSVSMVNDAFNNKEKGKDGLIPKDHKDVVSVLTKLRTDLYALAEYRLKPLPAIYKQAVWAAVWGWMLMGIVASQNVIHHKDDNANMVMTIILSFPVHGLLMYMLIFGWLRVADILSNPFGNDKVYDINLASTLDLNIWKSSITLENQEMAFYSSLLKNPYRKEESHPEETNRPSHFNKEESYRSTQPQRTFYSSEIRRN